MVDGGVTQITGELAVKHGANVVVVGTEIFGRINNNNNNNNNDNNRSIKEKIAIFNKIVQDNLL